MTRPRLQMKHPLTRVNTPSHSCSWEEHVRNAYIQFCPPFAANEGIDAVIRYMSPSRRRLSVCQVTLDSYSIESREGCKLFLSQPDEQSLMISIDKPMVTPRESNMELIYYDATDTARFIGQIFTSYRRNNKR